MPFVLLTLAMAFGVMLIFGGTEFDRGLFMLLHGFAEPEVRTAARWITELGGYLVLLPVTAAGVGFLLVRRQWKEAVLLAVIPLSGRFLVDGLKIWTARARPDVSEHLVTVQSLSFPSAHASNSTITWLTLALLLTRHSPARPLAIWAAAWTALLVGISRPILGVHWPTDVIGGWAFGLFWTLLLLRLSGVPLDDGTPRGPSSLPWGRRQP